MVAAAGAAVGSVDVERLGGQSSQSGLRVQRLQLRALLGELAPAVQGMDLEGLGLEELQKRLARLTDGVARYDLDLIGTALRDAVPEFAPMEASPARETGATIVAFPPRHARLS